MINTKPPLWAVRVASALSSIMIGGIAKYYEYGFRRYWCCVYFSRMYLTFSRYLMLGISLFVHGPPPGGRSREEELEGYHNAGTAHNRRHDQPMGEEWACLIVPFEEINEVEPHQTIPPHLVPLREVNEGTKTVP